MAQFTESTHQSLLDRLGTGSDPEAWREFRARYELLIRRFAEQRRLQPADCDDVVQEVYMALTRSMPGFRYDPAKGKFRSYLKTVVIHAISRAARQKRGGVALGEDEDAAPLADPRTEEAWEGEWRQYHLRRALRVLERECSPKDVEAFDAYVLCGRDANEVARMMQISVDRVYQAKSRLLRRLAEIVERQIEEEG